MEDDAITDSQLDAAHLISVMFDISLFHDRFPLFVETLLDLLDHLCPDADPEWQKYAALIREAHRAGFAETWSRVTYQQLLYTSAHHKFPSDCAAWKLQGLYLLSSPERYVRLRAMEWLEHVVGALSYMDQHAAAMAEFLLGRLQQLADSLGLDLAEWREPPEPLMISDEMVDAWVEENPDVQDRLRQFGL